MKKLFLLLVCTLGLIACDTGVSTSTPSNDARKISAQFKAAKTPKDIDDARNLLHKYQAAYQEEMYNGKRSVHEYREFMELVADGFGQ